jgi:hypothetical protein
MIALRLGAYVVMKVTPSLATSNWIEILGMDDRRAKPAKQWRSLAPWPELAYLLLQGQSRRAAFLKFNGAAVVTCAQFTPHCTEIKNKTLFTLSGNLY